MKYKVVFLLFFCDTWDSISLCSSNAKETMWFNEVVKFLLQNNDIAIDNFVILDHPDKCEYSKLCKNVWKFLFEDHLKIWSKEGYIPFLKLTNQRNNIDKNPNDSINSLFILTPQLSNIELLHEQTPNTLAQNSWLVALEETNA